MYVFLKNVGGLHCKRTVYIHGKIPMVLHPALLFDLADIVQKLLGPSHRK